MTIYPCKTFQPANIRTYNDHRMAMAFSLIGLRVDGITIENPSCVSKTFPTVILKFWNCCDELSLQPSKGFQPFKLGLIGYPLEHSLSPKIHTAALKAAD
jgi:hypothetical protein